PRAATSTRASWCPDAAARAFRCRSRGSPPSPPRQRSRRETRSLPFLLGEPRPVLDESVELLPARRLLRREVARRDRPQRQGLFPQPALEGVHDGFERRDLLFESLDAPAALRPVPVRALPRRPRGKPPGRRIGPRRVLRSAEGLPRRRGRLRRGAAGGARRVRAPPTL